MQAGSETDKIKQVVALLKSSKSLLFVTGAGISAESGLPTYRGVGGLYEDKGTDDGIPIEVAMSGEMLDRRPEITWKYLLQIEKNCRKARYNKAHEIIARMQDRFERVWVLTQNIDGFHKDAGSKNIVDIHGDIHKLLCPACGWKKGIESFEGLRVPPVCPSCNSIARPDVVFFGEMLPVKKLQVLDEELARGFDICFSVGTTSVFPYIQEPVLMAKRRGKPTVEINPAETDISHLVDIKLSMGAVDALSAIWKQYGE